MDYKVMIKKLRNKMFLTQSELAKELGVSIASVARWETGENEPAMKITIMHLIHIMLPI